MSAATVLGIVGALVIMVTLFEMLRRHRLREKYALLWFLIALGALIRLIHDAWPGQPCNWCPSDIARLT